MENNDKFPLKKDFVLNIDLDVVFGDNRETISKKIEYTQATILEGTKEQETIAKKGFQQWFLDILKNEGGFDDTMLSLICFYEETFEKILKQYVTTYFKGLVTEDTRDKAAEIKEVSGMPFSALLCLMSDKLNIDPLSFQEKYTYEQMIYLIGGIEYNLNEQSEEGQKINKNRQAEKNIDYDRMLIEKLSKF